MQIWLKKKTNIILHKYEKHFMYYFEKNFHLTGYFVLFQNEIILSIERIKLEKSDNFGKSLELYNQGIKPLKGCYKN